MGSTWAQIAKERFFWDTLYLKVKKRTTKKWRHRWLLRTVYVLYEEQKRRGHHCWCRGVLWRGTVEAGEKTKERLVWEGSVAVGQRLARVQIPAYFQIPPRRIPPQIDTKWHRDNARQSFSAKFPPSRPHRETLGIDCPNHHSHHLNQQHVSLDLYLLRYSTKFARQAWIRELNNSKLFSDNFIYSFSNFFLPEKNLIRSNMTKKYQTRVWRI